MQTQEMRMQERNREIGRVLREARMYKSITVTICANLIGTSRRRYVAMEKGEAMIGVAELEVLIDFLSVPVYKIWQTENNDERPDQVVIPFTPGRPVQIVFDIRQ